MMSHPLALFFLSSLALPFLPFVSGHGRLVEPPSRSSMWRFGFPTKPNYNDNELFCGGYTVHWQRNGGKCGICGDAWDAPRPRPNEAGGIYGKGIIVRKYRPGEMIKAGVQITANHKGFFEFKLCPHNNPSTEATQECLDRNPIELADGSGIKYYPYAGTGVFNVKLRLPQQVTCSQCVFQWTYTAGNNWGRCNNGSSGLGCGPQETFRGCADIAISGAETNDVPSYDDRPEVEGPSITIIPSRRPSSRPRPRPRPTPPNRPRRPTRRPSTSQRPVITRRPQTSRRPVVTRRPITRRPVSYNYPTRGFSTTPKTTPYPRASRPTKYGINHKPSPTKKPTSTLKPKPDRNKPMLETESDSSCHAVGIWKAVPGMDNWCDINCARGYCPASHCSCE